VKRNGEPMRMAPAFVRPAARTRNRGAVADCQYHRRNTLAGVLITSSTGVGVYGNQIGTQESPNGIGVLIQAVPATGVTNATVASNLVVMNTTAQISVAEVPESPSSGTRSAKMPTEPALDRHTNQRLDLHPRDREHDTSPRIGISVEERPPQYSCGKQNLRD